MSSDSDVPSGEHLVDPHYTRGDSVYEEMMNQVAEDGHQCPFCTMAVHPKPVLHQAGEGGCEWFITERHEVPENVKSYLLIIPKRHITEWEEEMTADDHLAVQELVRWAKEAFGLDGYGLTIRSGATTRTGATVRHLHYHLIAPVIDPATNRAVPYHFPIG